MKQMMNSKYYTYNSDTPIDNSKPLILAIVGKSASGKDTLAIWLTKALNHKGLDAIQVVSDTSRPPRENEVDGIDYFFISHEQFIDNISHGDYLEHTMFRGWYYGISLYSIYAYINVVVVNPAGLHSLLKYRDEYNIIPIFLEVSALERLQRSIIREKKIKVEYFRRMIADHNDFKDIRSLLGRFDHKIILPETVDGVIFKTNHIIDYLYRFGLCGLGNSQ